MSWWGFWGPPARSRGDHAPRRIPHSFCLLLRPLGSRSHLCFAQTRRPGPRVARSAVWGHTTAKWQSAHSLQLLGPRRRGEADGLEVWEVGGRQPPTVVLTVWKWTESGVFCSRKCPQHVSASGLAFVSCWAPPAGQGVGAPWVLPPPGTPLAPDGPSPGKVPRAARTPGEVAGWVQSRVLHRAARAGTAGRALALPAPPARSPPPDLPTPQASSVPSVTQGQESGFLPGERAPPPAQTRSRATEWAAE